tara:strand:- start:3337 stop:3960 length:624 start_codon:yes stop_codon:yes gene_type:complete
MIKGVKICGVSDIRTLKYIIDHKFPPKFVGFISNYPKSKRYVDFETLKKLTSYEKKKTNYVSVLVNPDNIILEKIKDLKIDYYQLYNVDPERTKLIKKKYNKKIITALTIESKSDINEYIKYQNIADIILFDGKGYEKSIGFNHSLLNHVTNNIIKMVAGNININNIPMLPNLDYIIDISGSLENSEGNKDLNKIDFFLKNINKNEN